MSKKNLFFLALLAGGQAAFAQTSRDTTGKQLDQVVVTATKYPVKQALTGKVLDVITREQLEKSGGKQLTEILNTQAGVVVLGAQNTPGTNQDIYLQGADAGKTLILIDGIPAYDPSGVTTAFDLNLINTDEVERIEILKGSQSTLYGSDAVAGVINIITKKGGGKPINASVSGAGGSYGTFKGSGGIDGQLGNTAYNVQYTHFQSKGVSAAYDTTGKGNFGRNGFNENIVLANISQRVSRNFGLRGNFQYSQYTNSLDYGAYTDDKHDTGHSKSTQVGIGGDYALGAAVLHFNYNYNTVTRSYLDDSSMLISQGGSYSWSQFTGRSHYAELYGNLAVSDHLDVLAGVDYRNQRLDESTLYIYQDYTNPALEDVSAGKLSPDSSKVRQFAAYASLLLKNLRGFNLDIGGRYNSFSRYGNVFTYSINPSYVINRRVKIFADVSSGFSAPTLYQLYSPYRNPSGNLNPEKTVSVESGIQYSVSRLNLRALYFRRHTKDNIVFYTDASFNSYYINLNKQDDHGFEVEASGNAGPWTFTANYTYTAGQVTTPVNGKDSTFNNLYLRPKNLVNASIGFHATKQLYLSAALRTVGSRIADIYSGTRGQQDSFAYYTLDGYAEYQLFRWLKLFGDAKNITDQKYFDIPGYTSLGFNFMAGISVHL
ncbi:TonB-dependent receptor plug domain-containing protein [Puia dinghuensis]|uniref:TonB-dependent receptor n=1 Tax=Puia dinghuensis TaxID=1792502 RepID=A0A8J2UF28_9BACT|nr:TonB-dependent receptor [Puia dinghuensis]GGB08013.1 TonB-dependent receptor [Puia dinghuensis]